MLYDNTGDGQDAITGRVGFYLPTPASYFTHSTGIPSNNSLFGHYWYDPIVPILTRAIFTPPLFRPIRYLLNTQVGTGVQRLTYEGLKPTKIVYSSSLDVDKYPGRLIGTIAQVLGYGGRPAAFSSMEKSVSHTNLLGSVKGTETHTDYLPSYNTTLSYGGLSGVNAFTAPFNRKLITGTYGSSGIDYSYSNQSLSIGTRTTVDAVIDRFNVLGLFSGNAVNYQYVWTSRYTANNKTYDMDLEIGDDGTIILSYTQDGSLRDSMAPSNKRYAFKRIRRSIYLSAIFSPGDHEAPVLNEAQDLNDFHHYRGFMTITATRLGDWTGSTLWSQTTQVNGEAAPQVFTPTDGGANEGHLLTSSASASSSRRITNMLSMDGVPYERLRDVSRYFQERAMPQLRPLAFDSASSAIDDALQVFSNDWIETLSELRELGKLLPSIAAARNLLGTLRNGQILESGVNFVDLITDARLYYSYGLAPNIDAAEEVVSKTGELAARVGGRTPWTFGRGASESLAFQCATTTLPATCQVRTKVMIPFGNETGVSALCSSWASGLMPSLSSAWNLLPFSFVVDMFLGISSKIRTLETTAIALVVKPNYFLHSYKWEPQIDPELLAYYSLQADSDPEGYDPSLRVFVRELSGFFPVPRESRLSPGLSPRPNWTNLASLVWKVI